MHFYFIVNGRKDKSIIREEVDRQIQLMNYSIEEWNDQCDIYTTKGEGDATRFVRLYCDLHPNEEVCFIACGGDGTMNEVASGLVGFTKKSMSVFNVGGNCDFIRSYPNRDFKSFHDILAGPTEAIDIIKANDSYSLNVASIGFDADVSYFANEYTTKGVQKPFQRGILRSLIFSRYNKISVTADGVKLKSRRLLLCTFANEQYYGDGMHCAPLASATDGLIEVCLIKPIFMATFGYLLPIYTAGKLFENRWLKSKTIYCRAKHIEMDGNGKLFNLAVDGEVIPATKIVMDILPKAINFRFPIERKPTEIQ